MADLKDLGWFPKEWIVTHFTDLSPDEIQELKDLEQIESDGGSASGGRGEVGFAALQQSRPNRLRYHPTTLPPYYTTTLLHYYTTTPLHYYTTTPLRKKWDSS
jgi:hypothetical protein